MDLSPRSDAARSPARAAGWALPTLLALALATYHLGAKSLWGDEIFSVTASRLGWRALWHLLAVQEANMGLHFALLHVLAPLGSSEFAVRAPSVLFTAATVPLIWLLANRLIGRAAAPVAAVLLASSPFVLSYAQEARGYALAMLLATAATVCFVWALDRPTVAAWLRYGAVSAIALDGHLFFVFVLVVHAVTLAVRGLAAIPLRGPLAGCSILLASSLPLAIASLKIGTDQIDWIQRPSLRTLGPSLETILGGGGALCAAWLVLAVVAVTSWSVGWRQTEPWCAILVVAWGALPLGASFALSLWRPILVERYLIVGFPGFVLLAAAGVNAMPAAWQRATATAAIVLLVLPGLSGWLDGPPREDWRHAVAYVAAGSAGGDGIAVIPPAQRIALDYYDSDLRRRLTAVFPGAGEKLLEGYLFDPPTLDGQQAADRAGASRRVWLVLSPEAPSAAKQRQLGTMLGTLAAEGYVVTRQRAFNGLYGSITVSLFERAAPVRATTAVRSPG